MCEYQDKTKIERLRVFHNVIELLKRKDFALANHEFLRIINNGRDMKNFEVHHLAQILMEDAEVKP